MSHLRRDSEARARVRALRDTPWLIYAITTGARGDLGKWLWQPSGASRNVLSDRFSYAQEETAEILGYRSDPFVSTEVACRLATASFYQGRKIAVLRGLDLENVMGIGMTSAVTTDRDRRGSDRVIVAVRTRDGTFIVDAILQKTANRAVDGEEYRVMQGELADLVTLNAILAVAKIPQVPLPRGRIATCAELRRRDRVLVPAPVKIRTWDPEESFGRIHWPDGRVEGTPDPSKHILFPGSFRKLTYAHDDMARMLEATTGRRVVFQISQGHPDKGGVPMDEMFRRAEQFDFRWPVILLRGDGLYVEKAERFPGVEMLVGADVAMKLFEPVYYRKSRAAMMRAMRRLEELGTVFHVNGRECADGVYRELSDIPMPLRRHREMFRPFSMRMNVSATAVIAAHRAAGAAV